MKQDLTADDFITGLLAALAVRGVRVISLRGGAFDQSMQTAYTALEARSEEYRVQPRFAIFLDPVHYDSPVVRQAVSGVVLRDIASLDNPEYQDLRLKISSLQAEALLGSLPGQPSLYKTLAEFFVGAYPYVSA